MTPFSQSAWACRCEWGLPAVGALAPADVTIVVDVFSFTTCVDVAVSRHAAILPLPWNDPRAEEFARTHGAELAGRRRQARYSLAPESYLDVPSGLRCVLPSPNGARIALAAAESAPVLLAGCLRNARAVAEAARRLGSSFNIIPARRSDPPGASGDRSLARGGRGRRALRAASHRAGRHPRSVWLGPRARGAGPPQGQAHRRAARCQRLRPPVRRPRFRGLLTRPGLRPGRRVSPLGHAATRLSLEASSTRGRWPSPAGLPPCPRRRGFSDA